MQPRPWQRTQPHTRRQRKDTKCNTWAIIQHWCIQQPCRLLLYKTPHASTTTATQRQLPLPPPHAAGTTITMVTRCAAGSTHSPSHSATCAHATQPQQCVLQTAAMHASRCTWECITSTWAQGSSRPVATHTIQHHMPSLRHRLQPGCLEWQQVSCCCPRSTRLALALQHQDMPANHRQASATKQGTNEGLPAQPWSAGPLCCWTTHTHANACTCHAACPTAATTPGPLHAGFHIAPANTRAQRQQHRQVAVTCVPWVARPGPPATMGRSPAAGGTRCVHFRGGCNSC
jgi:hypothetical protein